MQWLTALKTSASEPASRRAAVAVTFAECIVESEVGRCDGVLMFQRCKGDGNEQELDRRPDGSSFIYASQLFSLRCPKVDFDLKKKEADLLALYAQHRQRF